MAVRERAEEVLRALAGGDARLRADQWTAIEALISQRRRVLLVQRTGWGKSAVYFVATRLLRDAGAGPTVLISPLLALMRNQIAAAGMAGVRAATINSSNRDEWQTVYADVAMGLTDVLLLSPERLTNPEFREDVLPELQQTAGLIVVDEAHCISDWGHDFRPDYRRIGRLIAELPPGTPVLATTATANTRVTADVAEQLGADALVLRGSMERESLRLGVLPLASDAHALAWLDTNLGSLGGPDSGAGIIYCLTVAQVEQTAAFLSSRGHRVLPYTGATDAAEREHAEAALANNDVEALVATSALGMGYDKGDLGFVVHLGSPQSPVAYYQMVGRAGRATQTADVLLIPGQGDRRIWEWYASVAFPAQKQVEEVLKLLELRGVLSVPALENVVPLSRSRLEMMLKVLAVDGAVRRVRAGWEATGQPWTYDADRYDRVARARHAEQQAMLAYAAGLTCRMRLLRENLDDPEAEDCGRCDVCAGPWAPPGIAESSLLAAELELGRVGIPIEPRRLWPSGMDHVHGRIPTSQQALAGIAVASSQGSGGWPLRLTRLLEQADGQPPAEVAKAALSAVRTRGWPEGKPVGVLAVGSRTRPTLVSGLGESIAGRLKLPWLGALERSSSSPSGPAPDNSPQRVLSVYGTFVVPDGLSAALDQLPPDTVVLLVDDVSNTRWTMAEVARLLATEHRLRVVPLVLLSR